MRNNWQKIRFRLLRIFKRELKKLPSSTVPVGRRLLRIDRKIPGAIATYKILYREEHHNFILSDEPRDILFLLDDLRVLRREDRKRRFAIGGNKSPFISLDYLDNSDYTHSISVVWSSHILLNNGRSRCRPIGIWVCNLEQITDVTGRIPAVVLLKLARRVLALNIPGFSYFEALEAFDWKAAIIVAASQVLGENHCLRLERVDKI